MCLPSHYIQDSVVVWVITTAAWTGALVTEPCPMLDFVAIHNTTHCSPFEVLYQFIPLTLLDLLSLFLLTFFVSEAATSKTDLIKVLHKR